MIKPVKIAIVGCGMISEAYLTASQTKFKILEVDQGSSASAVNALALSSREENDRVEQGELSLVKVVDSPLPSSYAPGQRRHTPAVQPSGDKPKWGG